MPKKISTEDFVNKAIEKHGRIYNYSETVYEKWDRKVSILCPEHGKFFQLPYDHLRGGGCFECTKIKIANKLRRSKETLIEQARKVHGYKYDYSRVDYKKPEIKILILCPIHGEFYQSITAHLRGSGCLKCSIDSRKMKTQEFIDRAILIHGHKYDYSKVKISRSSDKVCLICKEHGEFWQKPVYHLGGSGCPCCKNKRLGDYVRLTTKDFIQRSQKIHGKKFDYSKTAYENSHKKITVICKIHGEFHQLAYQHLNGHGCPHCNSSKGELQIKNVFLRNNIEFKPQYSFPDLLGQSGKKLLMFDFYLPAENMLIEYDGEQHFRPCSFKNSPLSDKTLQEFKKIQYNDVLKNNYCRKKDIPLLRIGYKEFNRIPEILANFLIAHTSDQGTK